MRPDLFFEKKFFANEAPLTMAEEKAMDKYVNGVLKVEAPKIDDFEDLYPKEEIEADKREIERIKKLPEFRDQHERALIVAGIFYKEGEQSNWLGDETNVILTSEFDDIKRGSDFVLEIPQEDESFERLAVDLTISEDEGVFESKFNSVREGLRLGRLTNLKYYYSEISGVKGELRSIPRVVLQIKKDQLEELCKNIFDKEINKAAHPIQFELLEEAVQQLQEQMLFMDELNKNRLQSGKPQDTATIQKLDKILGIMEEILETKKEENKKRGLLKTSRFWQHSLPHFS